ncbi:NHL repeat-containing protein [Polluticaenibacter yanchengensis]|uniref:C1q domain-containing protein n=1 Tax=Polluticaenibacter yanchengensis TaxID=3014562 RepID=A0ABT4URF5_9BACT|nr:hypothetical protein [Chitinophagaceae bacterium LY-5]
MKHLYFLTIAMSVSFQLTAQNVGIGTTNPQLGKLEVKGSAGAVSAMFYDQTTGVAIENSFPGIGFNSYYNGNRKAINTGYGALISLNPATGAFSVFTAPASVTGAGTIMPLTQRMAIQPNGNIELNGKLRIADGTQGTGKVLTSDANGFATWSGGGGISFPYDGSFNYNGAVFGVVNSGGDGIRVYTPGNNALSGVTSGAIGVLAGASGGTGLRAYSYTGSAGDFETILGLAIKAKGNVEITGKIKIADGSQADKRVLTSDASGMATWAPLPALPTSVDISALRLNASVSIATGGSGSIITGWADLNEVGSANFNNATGLYIIPVTGFYQVNAAITWSPLNNGFLTYLAAELDNGTMLAQTYAPTSASGNTNVISFGKRFTAGQKIRFRAFQNSGVATVLYNAYLHSFSIVLVH